MSGNARPAGDKPPRYGMLRKLITMALCFDPKKIDVLIRLAIQEDIFTGDITTEALIPGDLEAYGEFVAKEEGTVAGLPVIEYFFSRLDNTVSLKQRVKDGDFVNKGDTIASVHGRAKVLLSGERIALNFLQRLSGIATMTARFVSQIKPLNTPIMDTRKTIPGWRFLEKYAVAAGGGVNHRMGLYDQALVKDNHLDVLKRLYPPKASPSAGAIENAVSTLRQKITKGVLVEVEARTLEEVKDALQAGVDIILFDNMDVTQLKDAVSLVRNWNGARRPLTEASGNVTLENVRAVAQTGVDRISIGAITHSAKALDISLEMFLAKNV